MTTQALTFDLKPRLRDDIVIGPPEQLGDRTVFYLKDEATEWYFRIGVAEHFVFSRLNGEKTLAEIGEEFEEAAGRSLDAKSWQKLFELLNERQMLADQFDPVKLEELRVKAGEKREESRRADGFMQRRFRLADPDQFLEAVLPYVRWAFSRWFVIPALLAFYAMEILIFRGYPEVMAAALELRDEYLSWPLMMAIFWGFAAFHEMAHGLACKYYGGRVRDMGIVWRYFWFFPYTKLDDIATFHNRWHRFHCAFAGVFMSMLIVLVAGIAWLWGPQEGVHRGILAIIVGIYNISIFRNFVPFLKLDGYFMLAHALRMPNLREESYAFWKRLLRKWLQGEGEGVGSYYTRSKIIYLWYGFFSFLFTVAFMVAMSYFWFYFISERAGYWVGILVVTILLGRVLYLRIQMWREKRREEAAEPEGGKAEAASVPPAAVG